MTRRILIKLGGAALAGEKTLTQAVSLIRSLRAGGWQTVLVHGGGPAINEKLRARGIEWSFVNGQRVTTPRMMGVIEETLAGDVNGALVRHFITQGIAAVGFSGAERETLLCTQASAELGQVGKIERVNGEWLAQILTLADAPVPVIAPIGVGADGRKFNINADWAAAHLAVALRADRLLFLTDQPGILDEEGQKIPAVGSEGLRAMVECRVVTGGMLAKTLAVLHALEGGVADVLIGSANNPDAGTLCRLQSEEAHHASV